MQTKLFYEDEYEALNLMISHSAKTKKELAAFLFPDRKPESAYARLSACLDPNKDERLTFGQIIAAMRFCGTYEPLLYACDETFHDRPNRHDPDSQEVKIVEVIGNATSTLNLAMQQLERLRSMRAGD